MQPVRIACVRYLNTAPLVEGLGKLNGVTLIPSAPADIAAMVRDGRADIGLASVIDAAGGGLTLLPSGMIGCDGATLTVRVYSDVPFDQITTVHADTESHTSVALCSVILSKQFGIRPAVRPFTLDDATEGWPETVLLIGDKAMTTALPEGRYPHQLDLGEAWKKLTGLPFVYAVWMCRPGEETSRPIRTACDVLERQVRRNAMRLPWIVASRAPEHGWDRQRASDYLGKLLRYEIGAPEREAVAAFLAEAARLALIGSPDHHWAEAPAAAGTD